MEEGGIAEEDVQEIEEIDSRPYPLRTLTDIITTDNPTLISGQYMDPPVVIALLDHDNQACTIWNEGYISF